MKLVRNLNPFLSWTKLISLVEFKWKTNESVKAIDHNHQRNNLSVKIFTKVGTNHVILVGNSWTIQHSPLFWSINKTHCIQISKHKRNKFQFLYFKNSKTVIVPIAHSFIFSCLRWKKIEINENEMEKYLYERAYNLLLVF